MAVKIGTTEPAPPTDTTVLGRNYLFATTEDIRTAIKALEFEVAIREQRDEVGRQARERAATRKAEVAADLAKFRELTDPLETPLYDQDAEAAK